jgi:hypothetical protein
MTTKKTLITDKRVLAGNTPELKHCQNSITLVLTQHLRKNTLYPPAACTPFLGVYSAYLPLGEKKHQNIFLFNYRLAIAFAGCLIICHET